jgi:WD40 repeat protein/serine/threonine protein kinase
VQRLPARDDPVELSLRHACAELGRRLRAGDACRSEEMLATFPEVAGHSESALELIYTEFVVRQELGQAPSLLELCNRFPEWQEDLRQLLQVHQFVYQSFTLPTDGRAVTAVDYADPTLPTLSTPGGGTTRLIGSYEVLKTIAHGGMGVVYKARQPGLNRIVALKMILAGDDAAPEELARFRKEAEAAAGLIHPNIVQTYEVGVHEGKPFFSMEYVEGGSLEQQLRTSPFPALQASLLIETLARAVEYAHRRGIIHRDLKPANILLAGTSDPEIGVRGQGSGVCPKREPKGKRPERDDYSLTPVPCPLTPKITDFGLAKQIGDGQAALTRTDAILGTPSYISPEQSEGKQRLVGPSTDVYALGAILYALITSRPPFLAETPFDTLLQVREQEPVPPRRLSPSVPRDLETICLKCLQKDPPKRYASALALAEDLRRFAVGEPIMARPIGTWERGRKWAARRPAIAALCATVVLITGVGLTGITWQWLRAEDRREAAETARANAELARTAEFEQRARAERALYFHGIALAHREWLAYNVDHADQLLEESPPELRNWEWSYLKGLCHADLLTLRGHKNAVSSVAFSPDGKRIASGGGSWAGAGPGEVVIWDASSGTRLATCSGNIGQVMSVAFSPDGLRVAAASFDGTVRVWLAATGEETLVIKAHRSWVHAVAFSGDGLRLASGSSDRTVKIWNAATGQELQTLACPTGDVFSVAFSPDGLRLASGTWSGVVQYWDVSPGRHGRESTPLMTLRGPTDVRSVAISPDGKLLVAASYDHSAQVWELSSGKELCTYRGHSSPVLSAAFAPDGVRVASAAYEGSVQIWNAWTGEELAALRGHVGSVPGLAFSPDGQRVVSGGKDRTIRVWDATNKQDARDIQLGFYGGIYNLAMSKDGRWLATAGVRTRQREESVARLWDLDSGPTLRFLRGHGGAVLGVAFNPNQECLATASADKTVKIWSVESGQVLQTLHGHKGAVNRVIYSPNGAYLASAGEDRTIRVWDAATSRPLQTINGHAGAITCLDFSPDSRTIASGSEDRSIRIWDAKTGAELLRCSEKLAGTVTSVVFSPDGEYFAGVGGDETIKIWAAAREQSPDLERPPLKTLRGHTDAVTGVCFSPDGQRLASSSMDFTVRIWDPGSGDEVMTLHYPKGHASAVAFSPDGRRLAASGVNIRVWEAIGPDSRRELVQSDTGLEWHRQEARDYLQNGYWYGAIIHLDHLLAVESEKRDLYAQRALAHAALGQWPSAGADSLRSGALDPGNLEGYFNHLAMLLLAGDNAGYNLARQELLERRLGTENARTAYLIGRSCSLGPWAADEDRRLPVALALAAVQNAPWLPWYQHGLALAYYRAGQYEEAARQAWVSMVAEPGWNAHVLNWLLLSMAYSQLGRGHEAQAFFNQANMWIDKKAHDLPREQAPFLGLTQHDWLACTLLRQEADALLKQTKH